MYSSFEFLSFSWSTTYLIADPTSPLPPVKKIHIRFDLKVNDAPNLIWTIKDISVCKILDSKNFLILNSNFLNKIRGANYLFGKAKK